MNRAAASILALSLMLAGCAVEGRPFERVPPQPKSAVIYVYRPYAYGSSLLRPAVTCGDDTARIGPGGYHAYVVPAGETVTCTMHTETQDVVEVHTDQRVYYIREEFSWGLLTGHPHLNPIDADTAQREIQTCCVQEK
jgi:hypothetical protein